MARIHEQNYQDWEIVLVDSGSTDGTLEIAERHGARIYHIPKEEFTFGRSLNQGCDKAQGRFLVFASGHVVPITNNWLGNLVKPFEDPTVAMVYGRQKGTDLNRLSELRDLDTTFGPASNILIEEAKANNGNSAVRRELWAQEPFDESLPGLEDVDWARKMERRDLRVYYAANAGVYHIHEESLRQVYGRYLREAVAAKRMFPGYRVEWTDLVKGVPYFVLRDILYAFRIKKRRKVFQIFGTRLAQFIGMYRGVRYQKESNQKFLATLKIPDTHRQLVVEGPNRHGLQELDVPTVAPNEALVQIAYAGVSQSDLYGTGGNTKGFPLVPGREFAGIVVRSGGGLKVGQKVVCGNANGQGAYAQYMSVPTKELHKIPLTMPLRYAAAIADVATCVAAFRDVPLAQGQTVCIFGAGPVGNICTQYLVSRGLQVTTIDSNAANLALLQKYDTDTLSTPGPLEKYEYLVDAGDDESGVQTSDSTSSGRVVALDTNSGTNGNPRETDWTEAIQLVHRGAINLEEHAEDVVPLEDYQDIWVKSQSKDHFKSLIRVSDDLGAL